MEAKELRIGNLVYAFKTTWVIDQTDFVGDKISTYKPIPLTADWLLRFGFEQDIGFPIFSIDQYYIRIRDNFEFGIDEEGGLHLSEIQYVHQLQNLYYALTGEELELK